MYEKVRAYMMENRMIAPGDRVLAGVSGGGDSMAMLSMLALYSKEMDFTLEAVHVHHGIRGEEADRDLAAVEKFCLELNIPLRIYRFDVPELSKKWKLGHEETGRIVRQQAFDREAARPGGDGRRIRIALAHNKNDLAETLVHHLARGSGLRGLGGIKPVNDNRIRPVLCLERKEIDHYLKEKNISFVTDSSNLEDDYTRNRIRHHILPLMEEEINSKAVCHIAEASQMIEEAYRFLEKCGRELLGKCPASDRSILLTEEFFREEPILQSYAVMEAFVRLTGKRRDISAVHVRQVLSLYEKHTGKQISLPYGLCARREYAGIRLFLEQAVRKGEGAQDVWELPAGSTMECGLGAFSTEIIPYFGQKISEKKYTKWLDYDKIKKNLCVRTRNAGDYIVISRDGRRKKIRRCMIDDKIPGDQRDQIPLVTCEEEVLWIVGGRISEKYKITPETTRVLQIRYQGGNQDE